MCHELFGVFGNFYASGTQDAEVTKSLVSIMQPYLTSICPFRNEKETAMWAKLSFAKTSGIITGDVLVSYWPIFFSVLSNSPRSLRTVEENLLTL